MKTAKEMFEELGYRYKGFGNTIAYSNYDPYSYEYKDIKFDNKTKTIDCKKGGNYFEPDKKFDITMQELQAINKQVEELGWLDA